MTRETSAQHVVAELLSTRHHPTDFTASRADYTTARLRLLALVLAVLLPLWIPVDYLLMPVNDFLPLAALRLVMAGVALGLYFFAARNGRRGVALGQVALLLLIPAVLYVAARLQLEPGSNNLLYGYAFFPVLMTAMLAVFPLTLLEGAAFGLPMLLGYGGLELALGGVFDPQWLSMLWLLSLVTLVALTTQLSQLRMLLDLFRRATRDTATGVFNRRNLVERLEAEHVRWERHERPLCVLLVELSGLNQVIEDHGRVVANRLLAQLADVMGRTLRSTDLLGRWNDSTLLAVLPETDEEAAQRLAARVREVAQLASVNLPNGLTVRGTPRVVVGRPAERERLEGLLARVESGLAA